jgi:Protein of unknown function (DUF429)
VTEDMLVAIDWSGRADDRGRTAWMAVIEDGVLCRLENGRSRPELRDELIRLRGGSGRLVAGIDFAFGFPRWYAEANGWASGRDTWRAAYRDGESWLASAGGPFWGRTTKRPRHAGDPLRRTERTAGGSPRSVFQIGGAGAVGTGSIRGMQVLHELAEAGFTIWPFEPAGEAVIIEIYPRLFTGKVVKSSAQACLRHLDTHYPEEELPDLFRGMAAATEDAFDAAVSALEMARARDALHQLPDGDDIDRIEGRIWAPLPLRRSSTPHRKRREGLRGDRTPNTSAMGESPVRSGTRADHPFWHPRSQVSDSR